MDEPLREYILNSIVDPHPQAVAPSYGVDLVAVARHAVLAGRRRQRQDTAVRLFRWLAIVALATGLLITLRNWLNEAELIPDFSPLGIAAGGAVLAAAGVWGTLFWRARAARLTALELVELDEVPSGDLAPALDPDVEDRLESLKEPNVVVYAGTEGDPFVGSGRLLQRRALSPVDVTRSSTDDEGRRQKLIPFKPVELSDFLRERVPALGFDGLTSFNRLYVRGDYARHVPDLLPDRYRTPHARVEPGLLQSTIANPTEYARTYLCFERILSGGDLVISMYVHVRLEQNLLSVEWAIYFLPPLRRRFLPRDSLRARGRGGATRDAFKVAAKETLPILFGGSSPTSLKDFEKKARKKRKARVLRQIKRGFEHDYGAFGGLREAVAVYETTKRFDVSDIEDSAMRLRRRLMDCVQEFLDAHGVDTSEFKDQVKNIYNAHVKYEIASVTSDTTIIGSHGRVNQFSQGRSERHTSGVNQ
ncbi:hypothetical protein [Nonomuraea jabiensis]|uniref:hypothetical protein n=1 Tax=Nonomuraea jabiensis TaxID=882448 RepID=UPI003D747DD4